MYLTGQCLCGQISYSMSAPPSVTGVCHCKNCQRQSGAAFSIFIGVSKAEMAVQGQMRTYIDHGDGGQRVQRCFCPECGSPILSLLDSAPGLAFVKAGTLDDTSSLQPRFSIWCKSAQPWLGLNTSGRNFPMNAPVRGEKPT